MSRLVRRALVERPDDLRRGAGPDGKDDPLTGVGPENPDDLSADTHVAEAADRRTHGWIGAGQRRGVMTSATNRSAGVRRDVRHFIKIAAPVYFGEARHQVLLRLPPRPEAEVRDDVDACVPLDK